MSARALFLLRWVVALLLLTGPPIWGVVAWRDRGHPGGLIPALWALVIFWVLVLVLLEWAGRSDSNAARARYGFLDVVIGTDGRVSTSKTAVAVWTSVFASALALLCGIAVFRPTKVTPLFDMDPNWNAYLLLLGGPFASAVLAKGIVSARVNSDPDAKSLTSAASGTANPAAVVTNAKPSPKDVVSNDGGGADLVDSQYTVFSLVAVCYFAGAFVVAIGAFANRTAPAIPLPGIPASLLGLTSLSALTYVGNKAVQTQGLRVAVLAPNPARPGALVTATVINLPATATKQNVSVTVSLPGGAPTDAAVLDVYPQRNTLTFMAPITPADYQVAVLAPDAYSSASTLTVMAAAAGATFSSNPAAPRASVTATLVTGRLAANATPAGVTVTLTDISGATSNPTVTGVAAKANTVTFTAPGTEGTYWVEMRASDLYTGPTALAVKA